MKKLIFFDLDGTLSPVKSWLVFNTHFGMTPEEDQVLYLKYIHSEHDYNTWIETLTKLLRQRDLCNTETFAAFVDSLELRPGAKELIAACKEKGYTTILLSGAIRQIAEHAAARLGIDQTFSGAEIIWNDAGKIEKIINIGDEAIAKLRIFKQVCAEHGADSKETIMVGDGGNDLDVFKETKKAIQLGEYEPLKPYAWKHVTSLQEVAALL